MNLFDITWHAFRRQKGKKAFLAAAMILCLTTVLTLVTYIRSQRINLEREFDEFGANIVITPKTDDLTLSYGGVSLSGIVTRINEIPLSEIDSIQTIHEIKNIRAISPKLIGVGPAESPAGRRDVLLVGVRFSEEKKIKSWWNIDGNFPEKSDQVLLGSSAAAKLSLSPGSRVTVRDREFTVSGVLRETGSQDDNAFILDNDAAGALLGREGKFSLVEVSALCSECPIEELVRQISAVMPSSDVKAIRQVMEQRMRTVEQFERFTFLLLSILLALCGLLIFTTVSGSVAERKKEIGIFRAVGYSRAHIMKIVLSESLLLSAVSGIVSVLLALLVLAFAVSGRAGLPPGALVYSPVPFVSGVVVLIAIAFLSSLGPARKASRIDPVETLSSL